MKLRGRSLLLNIGILVGGLLLLYQGYRGIQAVPLNGLMQGSSIYLALLALFVLAYTIFQQIGAWYLMMMSIGITIPFRFVPQGYILSFLPRYIPGTVWGYLSRAEWLKQDYQIPYPLSNLGSVVEIGVSTISSLIIFGLFLIPRTEGFTRVIVITLIIFIVPFSWFLLRKLGEISFFTQRLAKGIAFDRLGLIAFWKFLGSVCLITLNWFFYGFASLLIAHAFGLQFGGLNWEDWINYSTLYGMAWFIGFLVIFIPSGLGFREIVFSSLLVSVTNFSYSQASAISVLVRLAITIAEICWILVALVTRGARSGKSTLTTEDNSSQ